MAELTSEVVEIFVISSLYLLDKVLTQSSLEEKYTEDLIFLKDARLSSAVISLS